ncbi:MAG: signal peptidase I [Deltaproteobacteria bacterium]|nr:MAG: signal peptidase I [Deltaproteobacteria bacterium]
MEKRGEVVREVEGREGEQVRKKSLFREYLEALVIAVIIALFIRTFIIQAFKIPSGSMEPTLLVGDHIFVNKFIYGFRVPFLRKRILKFTSPKRGDIIVFIFPEDRSKDFIKRVVGVGGDVIEVRDKVLYVNGVPQEEPYVRHVEPSTYIPRRDDFGPFTVPQGKLFVMGDNRDRSYDSRFWGCVDESDVLGKAFIIYFSIKNDPDSRWYEFWKLPGRIRWGRIGKLIH